MVTQAKAAEVDLAALFPQGRVVKIGEHEIPVKPLTIAQIGQVMAILKPALKGQNLDGIDLLELISEHTDAMIGVCAIATGMKKEEVGDMLPDDFLALATAVAAVNIDFFVRRVAPSLQSATSSLATALGGGPTPSTSS